jgi:hypothetical protein
MQLRCLAQEASPWLQAQLAARAVQRCSELLLVRLRELGVRKEV